MKTYKLEDVFEFARQVEQRGIAFYESAAGCAQEKQAKDLFSYLRRQEALHARTFLKLYKKYAKKQSFFAASEQFVELFDVLSRGMLLPDISEIKTTLKKKGQGMSSILKIAMDVETNTILFYQHIQGLLGSKQAKVALEKIVKEEKSHLIKLKYLRADLDPLYAGLSFGKFF